MHGLAISTLRRWAVVLGLAAGSVPLAAEPVTLRFRPAPGTTLQFAQDVEQEGTMELGPMGTQTFSSTMRLEATQRVTAGETASLRRIEQVIDRVAMTMRQGDVEVLSMDSASPGTVTSEQDVLAPLALLVGRPFVVDFDELGTIRGAEGLTAFFESISASGDPQFQEALSRLEQVFNDDSMIQMMQVALPVLPAAAIEVGDSWTHRADLDNPMFGSMTVDSSFSFAGVERYAGEECARLTVTFEMHVDFGPLIEQMQGAMSGSAGVEMDVDPVESTGSLCIALADGLTLVSEMRPSSVMRMRVSAEGQDPMKMRMVMNQSIRQTIVRQ
jgi:hypothetical protein